MVVPKRLLEWARIRDDKNCRKTKIVEKNEDVDESLKNDSFVDTSDLNEKIDRVEKSKSSLMSDIESSWKTDKIINKDYGNLEEHKKSKKSFFEKNKFLSSSKNK